MIATALDKYRTDYAVVVWDVTRTEQGNLAYESHLGGSVVQVHDGFSSQAMHHSSEFHKPIIETALSETAHSVAWFQQQNKVLIVGMNNKQLKIFDLRGCYIQHNFRFLQP